MHIYYSYSYLSQKVYISFFLNQLTDIVPGRYVFRLKVTDDQGLNSEDTVSVIVKSGKYLLEILFFLVRRCSLKKKLISSFSFLRSTTIALGGINAEYWSEYADSFAKEFVSNEITNVITR